MVLSAIEARQRDPRRSAVAQALMERLQPGTPLFGGEDDPRRRVADALVRRMPGAPGQPSAPTTMERRPGAGTQPAGGFLMSLAQSESGGNFGASNDIKDGHFGRLQFSPARLEDAKRAGVLPADATPRDFLANPELQQRVEQWHLNDINSFIEREGLDRFEGQTVGGVRMTREGMKAMAHLGGQNGLRRFLESGGRYNPSDAFGTSLTDYAGRFGGGGGNAPIISTSGRAETPAPDVDFQPRYTRFDFELEGKRRPNPPAPQVMNALDIAAASAVGPGGRVVIYSGQENPGDQHGSNRHRTGLAADVRLYDPQGRLVSLDDPRAATFKRAAARAGIKGIGAGSEYMGDAFHMDMVPHEQYSAGQGPAWGSRGNAMEQELVGLMDRPRLGPQAPQTGRMGAPVVSTQGRMTGGAQAQPAVATGSQPSPQQANALQSWADTNLVPLQPDMLPRASSRDILERVQEAQQRGLQISPQMQAQIKEQLELARMYEGPQGELMLRQYWTDKLGWKPAEPTFDPSQRFLTDEQERQFGLDTRGVYAMDKDGKPFVLQAPPEQADPGYRMMTPDEVAQMPGLDPQRAYQIGPDNKITAVGGSGQTINVNNPGSDEFNAAFAKQDATALADISDAGLAAQRNLSRIDQLDQLLTESGSGFGASVKLYAGEYGINTDGLSELQAAQAVINSLVPEQRPPGSGPMSDADLELFKQSLPRIINQPGGNQTIIQTMRGIAEYDAQGAAIVQQLRAGQISRSEAFDALRNRRNPLEGFSPQAEANPIGGGDDSVPSMEAPEAAQEVPEMPEAFLRNVPEGVDPQRLWEAMAPENRRLFE